MLGSGQRGGGVRASSSTLIWFLQASSGLFLIFFMGVHLYVAHVNGGSPVELFDSVISNLSNPWWMAFFLAFVWIITYHALNGVRGIVFDLGTAARHGKAINYGFTAVYVATIIYCTYLTLMVAAM